MKLHLGAFNCGVEGWVNTDITPHIWVSKIPFLPIVLFKLGLITKERYQEHSQKMFNKLTYLNLTKKLSFASDSVEAVYSSHVLEHLFMN